MIQARNASLSLAETLQQNIPGYDAWKSAGECVFDEQAAQLAMDFFPEVLTHVKGEKAGQPFYLEPWQQAIIGNIFGWKRKDGTRRYREVLIYLPRKNGKTCIAAGIINYVLFCEDEAGSEIYSAAADREQATLVFDQAAGMVRQSSQLDNRATILKKTILRRDLAGTYKAISAEAATKHGYNTHCAIIDELHAQPNRELVDVLITSTGARRQPLIIHITTADFDRESICNEKLDYACKVRDGIIEDVSFLPVVYEASLDADWTDPEVWRQVNPNLNVSLSEEYLIRECQRAVDTPSFEGTFRRLHLNVKTEQEVRWLPMEKWDACIDDNIDHGSLVGRECYAGLDLSSTRDITALELIYPDRDSGTYILTSHFWIPADGARLREKRDRVPYLTWERQGYIHFTPGNVIDYRYIRQQINEIAEHYDIKEIGYDPYNATQLAIQLQDEDGLPVKVFRQGMISMNEPSKEFERLILAQKMQIEPNPVLRWMASNVAVKTDPAGNIKPVKPEHKDPKRIDGIVGAIMGIGLAMVASEAGSIYDQRGILTI